VLAVLIPRLVINVFLSSTSHLSIIGVFQTVVKVSMKMQMEFVIIV